MLTLKELKNQVKEADAKENTPSAKVLESSGVDIVVKEMFSTDAYIAVFANGYVLYREGVKTTVFPLHECSGYEYENNGGSKKRLNSDFFDNENWYVLLLMIGSDRMATNQVRVTEYHGFISYQAVAEDRTYLIDHCKSCLERMIEKELVKELLENLSDRQQKIVYMYFYEQMRQKDIAKALGIRQQSVCEALQRSLKIMKEHMNNTEN